MAVRTTVIVLLVFLPFLSSSQGSIVLVGGGSEKNESWSWSNQPYAWMIDQVRQKKVAILGYQEPSDPAWLVNYFLDLGATSAENFVIGSRESAEDESLNALIVAHDIIFIRGGDQSVYYSLFNDTRLEETIIAVFDAGGVVAGTSAGMAILSSDFFSAENGSVYPDEALETAFLESATFRNDFLPFNKGFLFDTHFLERGRHARLMSFLGNLDDSGDLVGIGIDDQTALCIDRDSKGTVFGTGAVTVVQQVNFNSLEGKPEGSFDLMQLLHGDQIDLLTMDTEANLDRSAISDIPNPAGIYDVHLASSPALSVNQFWLDNLVSGTDSVAVITASDQASDDYVKFLEGIVDDVRVIRTSVRDSCDRASEMNFLSTVTTFLWVENDMDQLTDFLASDPAGKLLQGMLKNNGLKHLLVGADSEYAGATIATNRLSDPLTSYYGELEFRDGLGLIPDMIVIPEIYDPSSTDFYENNTAALIYGLLHRPLPLAIGLNEQSFAAVYHEDGDRKLSVSGKYAGLVIKNTAGLWSQADQPVNASGDTRQAAGYDALEFRFLFQDPMKLSPSADGGSTEPVSVLEPVKNLMYTYSQDGLSLEWEHNGPPADRFIVLHNDNMIGQVSGNDRSFLWPDYMDGNLTVIAENNDSQSCSTSIEIYVTSVDGLNGNDEVAIFPNPVHSGSLTLILQRPGFITVHDLGGKRMLSKDVNEREVIDVSDWPAGIYLLKFCVSDSCVNRKIIVNRNVK